MAACEYFGVTIDALRETSERQTGRAVAEPSIDVEPALEEVEQLPSTFLPDRTQPSRLSGQPKHLPKLPQEHIYKQTPVFQTLSSHAHDTAKVQLEHRVDTSLLVEHSLRNLVKALDAAAAPPAKKPGLVFKFAGSDVPVVNYEVLALSSLLAWHHHDDSADLQRGRSGDGREQEALRLGTHRSSTSQTHRYPLLCLTDTCCNSFTSFCTVHSHGSRGLYIETSSVRSCKSLVFEAS